MILAILSVTAGALAALAACALRAATREARASRWPTEAEAAEDLTPSGLTAVFGMHGIHVSRDDAGDWVYVDDRRGGFLVAGHGPGRAPDKLHVTWSAALADVRSRLLGAPNSLTATLETSP